jgi:3-methyladenine DNA glycosylase/8-oxoguanine DNA glycosylase
VERGDGACRERFDGALDLYATLHPTGAVFGDPTQRATATEALRATRTPDGPATLSVMLTAPGCVEARAWGPGASWALARLRSWLALDDPPLDPARLDAPLRELARSAAGLRLARTERVFELLVPIVLEQLVSGAEASRAFARLVRRFSERAPGPFEDLWLPLGPREIRAIPLAAFPACGALERQGRTLHELAFRATRVEEAAAMDADTAERRLTAFPGVGVWTARSAMLRGMGHADAVPLGDYGLPGIVAYNLTGDARADDARMLELLEPFRGQRGRVVRWIVATGRMPERRAPRAALREIDPSAHTLLRDLRGGVAS